MPNWLSSGWDITAIRKVTKQEHFANLEPSLDGYSELVAKTGDIIYTVKGPPGHGTALVLAKITEKSGVGMVRVASEVDGPISPDLAKSVPSGYVLFTDVPVTDLPMPSIGMPTPSHLLPRPINYAGLGLAAFGLFIISILYFKN